MLKSIDNYIFKNFLRLFFISSFILLGIIWLTRIIKFIDLVTVQNMGIVDFLSFAILLIPRLFDFLIPLIALIASVILLNNFINTKEMTIFKSSGLSRMQIIKPLLIACVLIMVLNYLILFFITPLSQEKIRGLRSDLANEFIVSIVEAGEFNSNVDPRSTIFVRKKDDNGILHNLVIFTQIDRSSDLIINASTASLTKYEGNILLALNQGSRVLIENGKIIEKLTFDKYVTDLDFFTEGNFSLNYEKKLAEYMFFELFSKEVAEKFPLNKVINEITHRVLWPVLSLVLILYSATIIMAGEYRRRDNIFRTIVSYLVAFFIVGVFFLLKKFTSERLELVILSYIYIFSLIIIALIINLVNRLKYAKHI